MSVYQFIHMILSSTQNRKENLLNPIEKLTEHLAGTVMFDVLLVPHNSCFVAFKKLNV